MNTYRKQVLLCRNYRASLSSTMTPIHCLEPWLSNLPFLCLHTCIKSARILHTHGKKSLNTLSVKYYNDFLAILSSGRDKGEVSNLYVGDTYVIPLGSKYADFQQKITSDTSCGKTQTLYSSKVTTIQSLRLSTARVGWDFLLKIGILRAKGYNIWVPN